MYVVCQVVSCFQQFFIRMEFLFCKKLVSWMYILNYLYYFMISIIFVLFLKIVYFVLDSCVDSVVDFFVGELIILCRFLF